MTAVHFTKEANSVKNQEFTRILLSMTDTLYRISAAQLPQMADREDAVQETLHKA